MKTSGIMLDFAHQPTLGTVTLSGSDFKDSSPHKNHSTPTSVTTTVLSSGLGVPTFNGSSSKVSIPTAKFASLTNASIEVWAKATGDQQIYCFKEGTDNSDIIELDIPGSGVNLVRLLVKIGGVSKLVSGDANLTTNTWYHIVGLLGTGGMYLIQDGVLQSGTDASEWSYADIPSGSITHDWGHILYSTTDYWWTGLSAFLRIYSRRLSAAEALKHYTAERFWFGV